MLSDTSVGVLRLINRASLLNNKKGLMLSSLFDRGTTTIHFVVWSIKPEVGNMRKVMSRLFASIIGGGVVASSGITFVRAIIASGTPRMLRGLWS